MSMQFAHRRCGGRERWHSPTSFADAGTRKRRPIIQLTLDDRWHFEVLLIVKYSSQIIDMANLEDLHSPFVVLDD